MQIIRSLQIQVAEIFVLQVLGGSYWHSRRNDHTRYYAEYASGGGITNAQFTYINHGDAYLLAGDETTTRKTSSLHLL